MSYTHKDGGPAFPSGKSETPGFENSLPYYEGMTLRDWFAGMALQGLLAHLVGVPNSEPEGYARRAYQYADAMLTSRKENA